MRRDLEAALFRVHLGSAVGCEAVHLPLITIGGEPTVVTGVMDFRAGNVRVTGAEPDTGGVPGPDAYTVGDINLCNSNGVHAALADYYFWWCRRLLTKAMNASDGASWYYILASCCARAALTEVVEVAALLVHEYGHVKVGGGDHCVAAIGVKLSCGMYLDSDAFRHRMWAKFGLPRPQLHAGVAVDPYTAWLPTLDVSTAANVGRAQARFDYTAGNSWWFGFSEEEGDLECHPLSVEGLHCQLWSLNHGLMWSFSLAHGDLCLHDAKESAASIRFGPPCPEAPAEEPASRDWTTYGMVQEFYVPPPPKLRFDIPGPGAGDGPGLGDGPLPPDELPSQRHPVPL